MSTTAAQKKRIILGCMTFGPTPEDGGRVTDIPSTTALFEHFASSGYSELDTARLYIRGAQEAFTYAAGYQDLHFRIATKCYPTADYWHTPSSLRACLEKSLSELHTSSVDIFYLHAADRRVPFAAALACCDAMHREGKFGRLGLSNFAAYEVAEVATLCRERGWVRPSVYQAMYNCVTRAIESELVPACKRYGLDIVVYNPIAGGLFSPKFDEIAAANEARAAVEHGRFSNTHEHIGRLYRERYFRDPLFAGVKDIKRAAEANGLTLLETALRWLLHHSALRMGGDGNDGVIIGVSSLEQLKENLQQLEKGPLPEEVLQAIEKAWQTIGGCATDYWHGKLEYNYEWNKEDSNV